MTLERKAFLSGLITQLSYFGLILFYIFWFTVVVPGSVDRPWAIWIFGAVYVAPLLGFAPAVIKHTPRPHAWLCFLLLVYFVLAVLTAIKPHLALLGLVESLLIAVLFTAAMMHTRWQSQYLRQKNAG